jgi:hypothetical protein
VFATHTFCLHYIRRLRSKSILCNDMSTRSVVCGLALFYDNEEKTRILDSVLNGEIQKANRLKRVADMTSLGLRYA